MYSVPYISKALLGGLPWLSGFSVLVSTAATTATTALSSTATTVPPVTTPLLSVLSILLLTILITEPNDIAGSQPLGEVDLGTDGVGQVGDHEDILDMVVEVCLDSLRIDLGCKAQSVHEMLTKSRVAVPLLIQDLACVVADTVEETSDILKSPRKSVDVGNQGCGVLLSGASVGDGLEGSGVLVPEKPVGHGDEEAGFWCSSDRRGDVGLGGHRCAGLGVDGEMHGRVGEGARLGGSEEVLDKSGEGVELVAGRVPSQQLLAVGGGGRGGGGAESEGKHLLLVLNVDFHLVLVLGVGNGKGRADFHLGAVFAADTHQGANHPRGLLPTDGMIKDGEDSGGLDVDGQGRVGGAKSQDIGGQGPRNVRELLGIDSHDCGWAPGLDDVGLGEEEQRLGRKVSSGWFVGGILPRAVSVVVNSKSPDFFLHQDFGEQTQSYQVGCAR